LIRPVNDNDAELFPLGQIVNGYLNGNTEDNPTKFMIWVCPDGDPYRGSLLYNDTSLTPLDIIHQMKIIIRRIRRETLGGES
jgi:hypothetical protein